MLENYNTYNVLKVFLDSPLYEFGLREISRQISLALPSVKKYLNDLEKEGLILKKELKGNPVYIASIDSERFRFYKRLFIQHELFNSGLINYLWDALSPKAIILYGSFAKGESTSGSDIDLFVIGKKSKVDIEKFQKKLGKEVHLIIDSLENIPSELKNNLINGIIMKGYWSVIE